MAFFQTSVINKYINSQDQNSVDEAYKKFTDYFHNPEIQNNIREAKWNGGRFPQTKKLLYS